MAKVDLHIIMIRAHELARQMVGDYQARLALALRQAWREARQPSHQERAQRIAEAVRNDERDVMVKVWSVDTRSRVYVSRMLSRGRRQEMGYIEILEDGTIEVKAARQASWFKQWARIA